MAIYSGLFNSVNGDRKYDAWWFALYFSTFVGNGIYPNPSTNLQVIENENMTTTVKPGKGWINGYFIFSDSDFVLQHDLADGVLKRIDRVVMRLDYSEREIELIIKKGGFASNPVAPSLQRDADAYELVLADVLITPGATQIIQGNITDTRLNKELCGVMDNPIDPVDTTTIFNQYQSWYEQMTGEKLDEYNAWFAQHQKNFIDWFVSIKEILDSNVAGNLLLLIEHNQKDIRSLIKIKNDVPVLANGWTLDGVSNRYEYIITDADVTENSVVDVNIQLDYLDHAKMILSACNSGDGHVTMYSSDALDHDLVVDYRITRQVV